MWPRDAGGAVRCLWLAVERAKKSPAGEAGLVGGWADLSACDVEPARIEQAVIRPGFPAPRREVIFHGVFHAAGNGAGPVNLLIKARYVVEPDKPGIAVVRRDALTLE